MKYRAAFRCIAGCPGKHPLDQTIYRCPTCTNLLEVCHDISALKHRGPGAWMRVFDERYKRTTWPYGSAVWGKKEWVCPGVRDDQVVSMDEGGTNLFWSERYGHELGIEDLWIKLCGNSHTGSFKDLGMTVLVSIVRQMITDGKPVRAVACASTGDTSASLAAYAAAANIPAIVLLPRGKVSTAQLVQPIANGALVLALDTDFDGCMAIVQRLAEDEGIYLANSMNSLRLEGQKTVSIEIVQQLDWEVPDVVIIPGGNLGNVSALGAGFDMMLELGLVTKRPRIVVAQAAAANPLYLAYTRDWQFEPMHANPDVSVRDPDWESRVHPEGYPNTAAVRRGRRAGDRERARRRRRARRPDRHVQLPAHRRRTRRTREAGRTARDLRDRPRRRDLDGERTQVYRLQGRVSRRPPGVGRLQPGQHPGRTPERLRRRAASDRRRHGASVVLKPVGHERHDSRVHQVATGAVGLDCPPLIAKL